MTFAPCLFSESPTEIVLRPYQEKAIQSVMAAMDRGIRRGLIVAPTGTGKTVLFSALINRMATDPAFTALVLAHRRELLSQAGHKIAAMNPRLSVAIESGSERAPRGTSVVVAGVQATGGFGCEKLDWLAPWLVICDEAHHAAADSYQRVFSRMGCFDPEGAFLVGVTATPHRLDNKMLHGSDQAIFQEVLFTYSLIEAVKDGYLVDLRGYQAASEVDLSKVKTTAGDYNLGQLEAAVNTDPRNELAFKSWADVARDRRTIIFCAGVDHAEKVAEVFRQNGVAAESVNGAMRQDVRDSIIERFRSGETQVLTNMDIATEGFDVQEIGCVVLLRPTKSWSLFTQMIGRGLRVLQGCVDGFDAPAARRDRIKSSSKSDCIVIDIVDITSAHQIGKPPKQGEIPSLNELVGLPPLLDVEGKTMAEAVEQFEELPEIIRASAYKRPTSFSGLTHRLTQINLLAELDVPEEAQSAGVNLTWLKIGDLRYVVDCGFSDTERFRSAVLEGDILGNWKLHLKSFSRNESYDLPDEQQEAFRAAESVIRKTFYGVSRFADRNAPWRKGDVTDQQAELLRKLGVADELIASISKGKASMLITQLREIARFQQGEHAQ